MSTRTDWVDSAKAIGIVLVVYGHVARGLYGSGLYQPEEVFHLIDSLVYSFHMPLFFFLSGLFFSSSLSKRGGKKLLFNKIDTIVYPYIIWSILQGSVEALLSNYTNGNVTFGEVLALWNPRAQFWFLYALFVIFVVSTTIYTLVSERFSVYLFVLSGLLYVFSPYLPDMQILLYLSENLVFFAFGIVFTQYNVNERFNSLFGLPIILMAFVVAQYIFHIHLGYTYIDKGLTSLAVAMLSILLVVSVSVLISQTGNRYIAYLGASSMVIYLMHILAGSGTRIILVKLFGVESTIIHVLVGVLLGILLPLVALRVINAIHIPYVFSAPISKWITGTGKLSFQRTTGE